MPLFPLALLLATPSGAIDIIVSTNADSGNGSLRQAIQFNAALGGGNTILFSNRVTGIISLTSELLISTNVTIVGPEPGVLTVSGNNATRVFNITGGTVASPA
jgi:fibronectin-binding autotransporter adhesin